MAHELFHVSVFGNTSMLCGVSVIGYVSFNKILFVSSRAETSSLYRTLLEEWVYFYSIGG